MFKLKYTIDGVTHTVNFATYAPYVRAKKLAEERGYAIA